MNKDRPAEPSRRCVRRSAVVVATQAERMPGWIEQDPYVVLGLELDECGAQRHGIVNGGAEISDLEVEVHHRPLLSIDGRPRRRYVVSACWNTM